MKAAQLPVRILLAEDRPETRSQLSRSLRSLGYEVIEARDGREAIQLLRTEQVNVLVTDHRMPRRTGLDVLETTKLPTIVYSSDPAIDVAFRAGKLGAVRFLKYPFRVKQQLVPSIERLLLAPTEQSILANVTGVGRILGDSPATRAVREEVRRLGPLDITVLLTGETGTGKDVAARALHEESGRKRYLAVSITELAESLLESELFGYEQGAFTGAAAARAGLFEQANGGTLFLDEIGDAPLLLQAKLLRVLETRKVRRIGANESRSFDIRLVLATNRDLAAEMRNGRLREDLFYRLHEVEIHLTPLRTRLEDVRVLAEAFIREFAGRTKRAQPRVAESFYARLCSALWEGNTRQLRATIQRVVIYWDGHETLDSLHVTEALLTGDTSLAPEARAECRRMLAAYRKANRSHEGARRALGLTRAEWRHRWSIHGLGRLETREDRA